MLEFIEDHLILDEDLLSDLGFVFNQLDSYYPSKYARELWYLREIRKVSIIYYFHLKISDVISDATRSLNRDVEDIRDAIIRYISSKQRQLGQQYYLCSGNRLNLMEDQYNHWEKERAGKSMLLIFEFDEASLEEETKLNKIKMIHLLDPNVKLTSRDGSYFIWISTNNINEVPSTLLTTPSKLFLGIGSVGQMGLNNINTSLRVVYNLGDLPDDIVNVKALILYSAEKIIRTTQVLWEL